jgi:hypothetical protein
VFVAFLICVALGVLAGTVFFVNSASFSTPSGKVVCKLQVWTVFVPFLFAACAGRARPCIALGRVLCRPPPHVGIPMVRGP